MANPNPSPATRWGKGRSGNPGGRRRQPITEALAGGLTAERAAAIAEQVLAEAERGTPWAVQFLADRLEGKAVARNESGEVGDYDIPLSAIREKLRIVPGHVGR